MTVQILADSASDLPKEYFDEKNIILFPLRVHLENQDFEDQVTISSKKIFEAMRDGKSPKTSQVSPQTFKETFTELAKQEKSCLYVAFSSELSGTYQTAVMMANEVKEEYPNFHLSILDSKCASLGYGLAVMQAVKLANSGNALLEIEESVKEYSSHIEHIFTVDNLEYLARGGRISKASAFVGGLLNIKPLLHVEDGKLIPLEKIRGKKKVHKRIIELIEERSKGVQHEIIAISHGDDEQTATVIKEMIQEKFNPKNIYMNMIGSAVGSHSGPGTLAIFFLNKQD
ncbi:DegV family protein [Metabacillus arenae]|uniref:DegV family protein n=1 Tax=Metabacillus arenae TaxID=2771434 RepID=A0A926NBR1_9BACI|nr:DegV family protein [Metabacillus arenae]MBD1380579.1 DegV family protein [Metabacillus arenae]